MQLPLFAALAPAMAKAQPSTTASGEGGGDGAPSGVFQFFFQSSEQGLGPTGGEPRGSAAPDGPAGQNEILAEAMAVPGAVDDVAQPGGVLPGLKMGLPGPDRGGIGSDLPKASTALVEATSIPSGAAVAGDAGAILPEAGLSEGEAGDAGTLQATGLAAGQPEPALDPTGSPSANAGGHSERPDNPGETPDDLGLAIDAAGELAPSAPAMPPVQPPMAPQQEGLAAENTPIAAMGETAAGRPDARPRAPVAGDDDNAQSAPARARPPASTDRRAAGPAPELTQGTARSSGPDASASTQEPTMAEPRVRRETGNDLSAGQGGNTPAARTAGASPLLSPSGHGPSEPVGQDPASRASEQGPTGAVPQAGSGRATVPSAANDGETRPALGREPATSGADPTRVTEVGQTTDGHAMRPAGINEASKMMAPPPMPGEDRGLAKGEQSFAMHPIAGGAPAPEQGALARTIAPTKGDAPASSVSSAPQVQSGEGVGGEHATPDPLAADSADPLAAVSEPRQSGPSASTAAAAAPARADMAHSVAIQIAEVIGASRERAIELKLHPEELGRVSMTLTHDGGALTVALSADRGETLDLMRRHIDVLGQELRRLGYDTVGFTFGNGQSGSGMAQGGHRPVPAGGDGQLASGADHAEPAATIPEPVALSLGAGGIDIRL